MTSPDFTPLCGAGVRQNLTDKRATLYVQFERFGDIGSHLGAFDAQQTAFDFTKLHQLLCQRARHVARDCKTNTDAAATGGQNRGVNTDQLTVEVKQCAAGVTAVDRGVSLNKVFQTFEIQTAAA